MPGLQRVHRGRSGPLSFGRTAMVTRMESILSLRALLALQVRDQPAGEFDFSTLIRDATGSYMAFEEISKLSAHYSGTPRDVQVLSTALDATADQPAMVSLRVDLVSIPLSEPGAAGMDTSSLTGIFTPEQIQRKWLSLRTDERVLFSTLGTTLALPGDEAIICSPLQNRSQPELPANLDAKFSFAPTDLKFCKLYSGISLEQPTGENTTIATQQLSSTTNLYFGQTLGLGSFKQDAAHEVLVFVTPARANSVAAATSR